ncbi:hypothetical protein JD844_015269 [Phrynosoma platyrhinos]|uniref:Helicase ATP-binding domain-containing protein n=1 Tax=Phrynosoma platyrhinos TaxID=52577 RepID=A0ABQ7T7P7_PHRPL|nr:hypothetical protein JD844_015269 [Phrynosoma platyrhinos]
MASFLSDLVQYRGLFQMIVILGIGGSFPYGFHISVINYPSMHIKKFINDTWTERHGVPLPPDTVQLLWSLIVSIYGAGGLLGSVCCGYLTTKYRKKKCQMVANGVMMAAAVSMAVSKAARSFEMVLLGRLLYGIGIGFSFNIHPQYVGEISPKKLRGFANATVAVFLTLGKVAGQVAGLRELLGGESLWPFLLALTGVTALAQALALPCFPETPAYLLIQKGDEAAFLKAIRFLWGPGADLRPEADDLRRERRLRPATSSSSSSSPSSSGAEAKKALRVMEVLRARSLRWQLYVSLAVMTTLQLCGINAIYFYSFEVFRTAAFEEEVIPYLALGVGTCECLSSILCVSWAPGVTRTQQPCKAGPSRSSDPGLPLPELPDRALRAEEAPVGRLRVDGGGPGPADRHALPPGSDQEDDETDAKKREGAKDKETEEREEQSVPALSPNTSPSPPPCSLLVLGHCSRKPVQKVKPFLPPWLNQPRLLQRRIKENLVPLREVPEIHPKLVKKLQANGIESLFPVQAEVIPAILTSASGGFLTGRGGYQPSDICVSAPTGSGKTLAFVIPVVQALLDRVVCHVRALVVLPTKELAQQVSKVFNIYTDGTGLKVVQITGQKSFAKEQESLVEKTLTGVRSLADIVVATPGRLVDHLQQTTPFSLRQLRFLVIDEADRMIDGMHQNWLEQVTAAAVDRPEDGAHRPRLFDRTQQGPLTAARASVPRLPFQKLLFSATLTRNVEKLQPLGLFRPRLFAPASASREEEEEEAEEEAEADRPGPPKEQDKEEKEEEKEEEKKYTLPEGLSHYFVPCSLRRKPLYLLHFLLRLKFSRALCFVNSKETSHR